MPAPTRASTKASRPDGLGKALRSLTTLTRQVEQRARPPQTLACGTLLRRLASSTLRPFRDAHLAARIRHRDHSAPALVERARAASREHQQDRRRVTDREIEQSVMSSMTSRLSRGIGLMFCARQAGSLARRITSCAPWWTPSIASGGSSTAIDKRIGAAHRKNGFMRSQK